MPEGCQHGGQTYWRSRSRARPAHSPPWSVLGRLGLQCREYLPLAPTSLGCFARQGLGLLVLGTLYTALPFLHSLPLCLAASGDAEAFR